MAKDHGSSVKDDKQYEGLRKKGMSKSRAAAIANSPNASKKGGKNSGGGGSSQAAFGARAGATVLTNATTILGALFMLGAIMLGVYGSRGPGSVLSGVKGPSAPVSTPAPAPVKK